MVAMLSLYASCTTMGTAQCKNETSLATSDPNNAFVAALVAGQRRINDQLLSNFYTWTSFWLILDIRM